jgi:hypothetical protein
MKSLLLTASLLMTVTSFAQIPIEKAPMPDKITLNVTSHGKPKSFDLRNRNGIGDHDMWQRFYGSTDGVSLQLLADGHDDSNVRNNFECSLSILFRDKFIGKQKILCTEYNTISSLLNSASEKYPVIVEFDTKTSKFRMKDTATISGSANTHPAPAPKVGAN